jgi:hypothetical protein
LETFEINREKCHIVSQCTRQALNELKMEVAGFKSPFFLNSLDEFKDLDFCDENNFNLT